MQVEGARHRLVDGQFELRRPLLAQAGPGLLRVAQQVEHLLRRLGRCGKQAQGGPGAHMGLRKRHHRQALAVGGDEQVLELARLHHLGVGQQQQHLAAIEHAAERRKQFGRPIGFVQLRRPHLPLARAQGLVQRLAPRAGGGAEQHPDPRAIGQGQPQQLGQARQRLVQPSHMGPVAHGNRHRSPCRLRQQTRHPRHGWYCRRLALAPSRKRARTQQH
ncbi:MAG: hypothetical protein Q7J52_07510 [Falsiroseomonas sp.]|nr:hypothetical protein [Falsiroseomonas sp.]